MRFGQEKWKKPTVNSFIGHPVVRGILDNKHLALAPGLLSAEYGDLKYFLQIFFKWHADRITINHYNIYQRFQLLQHPAGTPPQDKILFLSPMIRFLTRFQILQYICLKYVYT